MQLSVHLSDGRLFMFNIADGQATTEFLSTARFWEIYDRPILRIHDRKDTWAFNPTSIEKIHLVTTENPGWHSPENIITSKCISLENYRRKMAAIDAKPKSSEQRKEGELVEVVLKAMLSSGTIEYFESFLMLADRHQQMINLYKLFQRIGYAIPCETGGFILLNPSHIVCIHLHPGFSEDHDTAWVVDSFVESNSKSE